MAALKPIFSLCRTSCRSCDDDNATNHDDDNTRGDGTRRGNDNTHGPDPMPAHMLSAVEQLEVQVLVALSLLQHMS